MRQSTTVERALVTGKASPAYPPIAAPTPVGTIITLVYALLNCSTEAQKTKENQTSLHQTYQPHYFHHTNELEIL